ncbi:hypothetical protein E4P29_04775 [Rhodococcus sp. 1R11]|uniref:hypothetical protein n=1 Tax=Rhodococcus sp. 1R11 TaxID=2559614 RepID=UPI0010723D9B|nr:hypothetical protein [Rhodococcus sp. 1R11]TFI45050.1 hypothetical protein E4P29_04775 [Rhodococcus sp. 1R11]
MGLNYRSLDVITREAMAEEVERDVTSGTLYISPRLTDEGARLWPDVLRSAVSKGTDDILAQELVTRGFLKTHELGHRNGKPYSKAVPVNAASTLAEGEFNRFYLRGIASRGVVESRGIEIYRGRSSSNPRSASVALEGQRLAADVLLDDLRANTRTDTALGLPPGPNSGLTGELV